MATASKIETRMAERDRAAGPQNSTAHSTAGAAYLRLREGLMWGQWPPGEKLKPQHLKQNLHCASGALREALIRLAGEGFVTFEEQRGFTTIVPSKQSFYEARDMRLLLEIEACRLAIEKGDVGWEADLIAAHHRLAAAETMMLRQNSLQPHIRTWSMLDMQFHLASVAACGSALLLEQYRSVYDKYRLHAVTELRNFGFRGETTIAEHRAILEALLARDFTACGTAIETHLAIYRSRQ